MRISLSIRKNIFLSRNGIRWAVWCWLNSTPQWQANISYKRIITRRWTKLGFASNTKLAPIFGSLGRNKSGKTVLKRRLKVKTRRNRDLWEGEAEIKSQDSQSKNQVPIPFSGEHDTTIVIPPKEEQKRETNSGTGRDSRDIALEII